MPWWPEPQKPQASQGDACVRLGELAPTNLQWHLPVPGALSLLGSAVLSCASASAPFTPIPETFADSIASTSKFAFQAPTQAPPDAPGDTELRHCLGLPFLLVSVSSQSFSSHPDYKCLEGEELILLFYLFIQHQPPNWKRSKHAVKLHYRQKIFKIGSYFT